jgi:uncharacterized protein YjbI with pentapeptide repeats
MTAKRACGHTLVLVLISAVAIYINVRSGDRPLLRRFDTALLPLLQADNPYLLNGIDLRPEGMGAPLPLGQLLGQDLSGMDLRKASFSPRGLRSVNLRGSHLVQANFSCVPLRAVDLSGADLREARLDFSGNCSPPPTSECPKEMTSAPGEPTSCVTLEIDLVGANLSNAILLGEVKTEKKDEPCKRWLVIKGYLDGARFNQAKLSCVALINESPTSPSFRPPAYAGISFVSSQIDHLWILSGNFIFSDFYKARVNHLRLLRPINMGFRFSSFEQLRCPSKGCWLEAIDSDTLNDNDTPKKSSKSKDHTDKDLTEVNLSLNVRGSRISSNLHLARKPKASEQWQWPALICNKKTVWKPKYDPPPPKDPPNPPMHPSCDQSARLLVDDPSTKPPIKVPPNRSPHR